MSTIKRAICSVVLVFPVLFLLSVFDKTNSLPRPVKAAPVTRTLADKPDPSAKATPARETLEKRRQRMKQRDGEIDRLLKGKQHPER